MTYNDILSVVRRSRDIIHTANRSGRYIYHEAMSDYGIGNWPEAVRNRINLTRRLVRSRTGLVPTF